MKRDYINEIIVDAQAIEHPVANRARAALNDLESERDRLRATNAELLVLIKNILVAIQPDGETGVRVIDCFSGNIALYAAIAKAEEK